MVIESRADRASQLVIVDVASPLITLCADARFPDVLRDAGIDRPQCAGLLALTSLDEVNQTIAIGAHTLRPGLQIIARVKNATVQTNLRALGGIQVVNPFDTFATNLALDLDAPDVLRLEEWLTDSPDAQCPNRLGIPTGSWVIVGFGRFGRAIARVLDQRGIAWRAVETTESRSPATIAVGTAIAPRRGACRLRKAFNPTTSCALAAKARGRSTRAAPVRRA